MSVLSWETATTYRYRKLLEGFRCTDEDLRMEASALGHLRPVHSRMHEWTVQDRIQGLRVPLGRSWTVRVGFDGEGIAAVQVSQEVRRGAEYDLAFGAVASRWRGLEGARLGLIGDEMLSDTFDHIQQRCIELGVSGDVRLTALIHRENFASKHMCGRSKRLRYECDDPGSETLEVWSGTLPIPDSALFDA